ARRRGERKTMAWKKLLVMGRHKLDETSQESQNATVSPDRAGAATNRVGEGPLLADRSVLPAVPCRHTPVSEKPGRDSWPATASPLLSEARGDPDTKRENNMCAGLRRFAARASLGLLYGLQIRTLTPGPFGRQPWCLPVAARKT